MSVALENGAQSPVDLDVLSAWLDTQGVGNGPITDVSVLSGGTQNVMLRFRKGDSIPELVLRHPPPHKRANSDETMRREARLLLALESTDVPIPHLIAACPSVNVLGSAFYVMQSVSGFAPTLGVPEPYASNADWQRQMGLSMADAIAALGRVDHESVGLGDFGRAENWLERQVERWRSHLSSYEGTPNYPGHGIEGVDALGGWLDAHRPAKWRPGIIHGDFHFANVMFAYEMPAVAAMVDWELGTIGDPLLDLGHLLATFPATDGNAAGVGSGLPGLPSRAALIDRYADSSNRDITTMTWYQVLACYRLGIILEGTNARAFAGLAPRATGDQLHATTLALFAQARDLAGV